MSRTNRAVTIKRQENALALLSDLTHAAEVLGLLLDEEADQAALTTIRAALAQLKTQAIARRLGRSTSPQPSGAVITAGQAVGSR